MTAATKPVYSSLSGVTPESQAVIKKLSGEGKGYQEVSETLNALAAKNNCFKFPTGIPWSEKQVSLVAISMGIRRRRRRSAEEIVAAKQGKASVVAAQQGVTSKWDVLKCIENCSELNAPTRKALLNLVWQELHK